MRSARRIVSSSVFWKSTARRVEIVLQHEIVEIEHFAELRREPLAMEQVLQADRAPRHLVLVRRPDAAAGGADLARALGCFARQVERHVIRQDQRAGLADLQPRAHVDAGGLERPDLLDQRLRREHDAVADVAGDLLAQDAGRDQVQHRLLAADHQRMAGVVTALEAHDTLGMIGEPVDDLALALVAPLGADYDYILRHSGKVPYLPINADERRS